MLNKVTPVIIEMAGKMCVVAESSVSSERADFITKLLELNNYEVLTLSDDSGLITIGVTDLLFNPVLDVYKRRLKSFTGHKVTPAYWLQISDNESEKEMNYWNV